MHKETRKPSRQHVYGNPADHLVRAVLDAHHREDIGQEAAKDDRSQNAEPRTTGIVSHHNGGEGANKHLALESNVNYPRTLGENAPYRGDDERCRRPERRHQ
ncbi:MAG: hypothetical protein DDT36_01495 [Firmicutes bacterium]|nr:hypothetical protein [Bacillota bacterium]